MAERSSHELAPEATNLAAVGGGATLPEALQLDIPESSSSSYESAQEAVVADLDAALPEVQQLDIPESSSSSYQSAQEAVVDLAAAGEDDVDQQLDILESLSSYESAQEVVVDLAAALPELQQLDIPESSSSSYKSAQEDLQHDMIEGRRAFQTMDVGMTPDDRNGRGGCDWVAAAWSLCQHWPGPMDARFIYTLIYLFGDVLAWVLRENPKAFFKGQRHSGCHGDRDCLASEAVLMISFANFLFFSIMGVSTLYTKTVHDLRSSWHSGWWPVKLLILLGCYMSPIVVPDYFLRLYGRVAPFGAGIFLVIQLICAIRYITWLNSKWCGQANFDKHCRKVNLISKLAYGCSMVGIIVMVLFYMSYPILNGALIFATLVLVYIMPLISLLTKGKGFYMEPLLTGLYIVFLCWSAIQSEPGKENTNSGANWKTMISFTGQVVGVIVNGFSTGTYYKCIQFANIVPSGNDVPYGYGFFHFVFASASMNFGMMFLGWDTRRALGRWSMDVGWTSTIVHLVNEGLAVILFVMVILARFYGVGWLQQLLGNGTGGQQQLADECRAVELVRFSTDNNGPPRESPTSTRRDGTETINDESPRGPRTTEPVETDRNTVQPPSSSSTTIGPHLRRTSDPPQVPDVVGRQYGDITEHWLS